MASPIQAQILVHIRAVLSGMPQVQAFMNTLRGLRVGAGNINGVTNASKKAGDSLKSLHNVGRQVALTFYSLGRAGHYLSTILFALSGGFAVFLAALTSVIAAAAGGLFALLIKEGVEFNSEIEQLRLGFASLIFSFAEVKNAQGELIDGQEKWNRSMELGDALMDQIFIKTFQTNRTVNELAAAFQSGLAPALNAGLSLQQSLDVITRLVQAADVFKLKSNEINEEVRNLLAGNATRDTRIAVALFGSATAANKAIEQAKSQGKLLDLLTEKLEGFQRAGKLLPKTFEGALSNLRDLFKRVAGEISTQFKAELTKGFVNVFDRIVDTEKLKDGVFQLRPEFQKIADKLKEIADFLAHQIPVALDLILDKTAQIFNYVEQKGLDGTLERTKDLLGEIHGLVGTIFSDVQVAAPEGFLANIFKGATLVVHVLREIVQGLKVLSTFVQFALQGVVIAFVSTTLALIARLIESIIGPNGVSDAMFRWYRNATGYLTGIKDKLVEQWGVLRQLIDGYDKLAKKQNGTGVSTPAGESDVAGEGIFRKAKTQVDLNSIFGKNKNAADDEKKKLNGLKSALRELTTAKIELARTQAQTAFDITRDVIKRELELNQQKYDDFKVSLVEFYRFKTDHERGDLAREIKYLEDLKAVERDRLTLRQQDIEHTEKDPKVRDTRLAAESLRYKERTLEIDTKIGRLQKEMSRAAEDNDRARRKALEDLDKQFRGVEAQLKGLKGDAFGEALDSIDLQFEEILKKFKVEFGEGSPLFATLLELIQRLKLKAGFDEDFRQIDFIDREKQLRVNDVQDQLNRGKITQIEYEREINKLSDEYAKKQLVILRQALAVAQAHGADRDVILRLQEAIQQLEQSQTTINSLAQNINGVLRDSIGGFFDDLIDGTQSFGDSVRKMASRILADLARVLIQAVVLSTIFKALGIGVGSTGGIGGAISKSIGGFASGGIIPGPPSTSDSLVARLSTGEAIIPARNVVKYGPGLIQSIIDGSFVPGYLPRFASGGIAGSPATAAQAQASPVNLKVVNAIDPREILNQLRSSDAREELLNLFSSNQGAFKSALGLA